jgi:hypothetical protein
MEYTRNGTSVFDGMNYSLWRRRLKFFLKSHGFDVWQAIMDCYKALTTPPTNKDGKKLCENNSKAMNSILSGMVSSVYVKVMHCDSAKDIWDKLQNVYEGDEKFKGAKLQTYRGKFEQLEMKEGEDIATYFL